MGETNEIIEYFQGKLNFECICNVFWENTQKLVMYEADVDMNVGCYGFQTQNAVIHCHWFQSQKLRGVLCTDAGYLMKRKTHLIIL